MRPAGNRDSHVCGVAVDIQQCAISVPPDGGGGRVACATDEGYGCTS